MLRVSGSQSPRCSVVERPLLDSLQEIPGTGLRDRESVASPARQILRRGANPAASGRGRKEISGYVGTSSYYRDAIGLASMYGPAHLNESITLLENRIPITDERGLP